MSAYKTPHPTDLRPSRGPAGKARFFRDWRLGALAFLAALGAGSAAAGCASSQVECHPESFEGVCKLVQISKVKESEFPLPSVVLEGLYRPQPNPSGPNIVPEDARRQFGALERYEEALRAHLEANNVVRCYLNPPPPGQCHPGPWVVEVPEFDATQAQAPQEDSGPRGCAQIEAASTQDRVTQSRGPTGVITQRFEFAEGSVDLAADVGAALDSLAEQLKRSPNIQCVGVVGAWVRGESAAIAFARARAVRQELISRGVEAERMIALTVDPSSVGMSGTPEPPNPRDRKVTISVLLELPSAR